MPTVSRARASRCRRMSRSKEPSLQLPLPRLATSMRRASSPKTPSTRPKLRGGSTRLPKRRPLIIKIYSMLRLSVLHPLINLLTSVLASAYKKVYCSGLVRPGRKQHRSLATQARLCHRYPLLSCSALLVIRERLSRAIAPKRSLPRIEDKNRWKKPKRRIQLRHRQSNNRWLTNRMSRGLAAQLLISNCLLKNAIGPTSA